MNYFTKNTICLLIELDQSEILGSDTNIRGSNCSYVKILHGTHTDISGTLLAN